MIIYRILYREKDKAWKMSREIYTDLDEAKNSADCYPELYETQVIGFEVIKYD